jgi:hypothetical protein
MADMSNISVHRYGEGVSGFAGWIEPDDLEWIVFITDDNKPLLFARRDPETGAVLDDQPVTV